MQNTFFVSLQDKEVSYGAHAPRILALDDYFLMEVEKSEQDPDTGKKIKKKVRQQIYQLLSKTWAPTWCRRHS